jgi:hypothetical protein
VLPPAGIASPVAVSTGISGTTFTDTFGTLLSYTVMTASGATAVFFLDNQNQTTPQVRLTVNNATSTLSSFLLAPSTPFPPNGVLGPASSSNNFAAVWVGTSGTQLGTGFVVTTAGGGANQIPLTSNGPAIASVFMPPPRLFSGSAVTVNRNNSIIFCPAACTVTPSLSFNSDVPSQVGGQSFCVRADDNVAAVITLAALPNVAYENTSRTSFKPVNTPLVSSGAVGDQICMVARSNTQYAVLSFSGTWN